MDEIKKQKIHTLACSLAIDDVVAELLVNRGVEDEAEAKKFLYPSKEDFEDPFVLSGMTEAANRIRQAVDQKEKIVVYGDYDCDGITATSILYDYLSSLGADVSYFIPSRFDTGYGLSVEALESIAETYYPDLIVTVDCGISSVEEAEYLQDVLAVDLVVTDHHMLPETLPNAILVDPKLCPDSSCVDLCGAGVAFKLVQALGGTDAAWKYIELAAIATIADIVPMTGENRLIVSLGLQKINSREPINKGLELLIRSIELKKAVDTSVVGFQIAPRINSLGRIGDATESVRLFVGKEFIELEGIVDKMNRANEMRRSLLDQTYREAREMMKEYDLATHKIILLYKKEWSTGIIGLVCGKLRSDFNRPVILLCGEDELTGSGRSTESVDIYQTIKSAEKFLVRFGGHKRAAGLTVKTENLIDARNAMDAYLEKTYSDSVFSRDCSFELELPPEKITLSLADGIEKLAPFGEGNPKPIFKFSSKDVSLAPFGTGENVKGIINNGAEIIGFSKGYLADGLRVGLSYDYLCECSKNEFKNVTKVQMRILSEFLSGDVLWRDPLSLFNRYLRANMYPEKKCDYSVISASDLSKEFYDDRFCTLFIAFSTESVDRVLSDPALKEKLRLEYGKPFDAPWNEVLMAPEIDPVGYKKIVLLDTPLTTGYVQRLASSTGAEISVVSKNYPYENVFRAVDLSYEAIEYTYKRIERFVYSGGGASSPIDLSRKLSEGKEAGFLTRLYVLIDAGVIVPGQGFSLSLRPMNDLSSSVLFARLSALKKKL